ncbi:kinase-like domain-containing protein [Lanmaoa asiatica]|nr:kinase-like domain-containing protein [Lanmaoa asiatica]
MRDMNQNFDVPVGSKRKRVVSVNENAHANGRPTRGFGRPKRRRAVTVDSETDNEAISMDVDAHHRWSGLNDSEADSDREESCKLCSHPSSSDAYGEIADEFLISEASTRQLLRLRKDELVRLYVAAGLSDDSESLTKPELVDAIISARDEVASLPPSSSPGRGDGNYSDFSSDDGNIAGDEETDVCAKYTAGSSLRRRVTVNGMSQITTRALKTRTLSLGQLNTPSCPADLSMVTEQKIELEVVTRRRNTRFTSTRSSPTMTSSNPLPSPPATRLRTRKGSGEHPPSQIVLPKAKAKPRQVEFSEDVQARSPLASSDESELTDLAELEAKIAATSRSPRRLRSRDKVNGNASAHDQDAAPMQRARCKGAIEQEECEMEVNHSLDDEEEVDELISSPSPSPSPPPGNGRRTPVKRRLRPRRMQTHTPPRDDGSEGDDEEEEDQVKEDVAEEMDDEDIESLHEDEDVYVDNSLCPVETTPRKLRSGKVVGGEDSNGDEQEEQDDQEIDLELESVDVDADSAEDVDADGTMEEEDCVYSSSYKFSMLMVDEVDLTLATKKTLIRLRRDDLVRLCETRDLDVAGTKPQLAQSLLQWRDRHANGFSSPSSTGTVRPPSTIRVRGGRRRTSSRGYSTTPPILMRPHRVHQDQPCTPPISVEQQNQPEPELELDLESLGLEDREIPPDKLTKLEKIGSGGFKDVYIGKFKGRRVAIAEFRDQLSSMDIKELKLLGVFDHPNIVRFLGVSIPENTRETPVMIVSELCSNGDLFDYIRNVPAPSLYKVLSIMLDIAYGLEYLHTRKPSIIHRDCKSSNILITSRGAAKIADFGLAKVKQSTRSMVRSVVGTVNWQAPELWHAHPKYNHKADVFSCAMVFWEMLQWHLPTKRFPWEGMNEHAIYETVGAKRQRSVFTLWHLGEPLTICCCYRPSVNGLRKQYCAEIVGLIECMWAHDSAERPTMSEVVQKLEQLVAAYR